MSKKPHVGGKGMKCQLLRNENYFCTIGFARMAARELKLWDIRKTDNSIKTEKIDNGSGILHPLYDFDTSCAICASMNNAKKTFHLMEIPIDRLTFYPLRETLDLVSEEKDPFGDLRGSISYLTEVGLDNHNWDISWGIFLWEEMNEKGEVKVKKQLP